MLHHYIQRDILLRILKFSSDNLSNRKHLETEKWETMKKKKDKNKAKY